MHGTTEVIRTTALSLVPFQNAGKPSSSDMLWTCTPELTLVRGRINALIWVVGSGSGM